MQNVRIPEKGLESPKKGLEFAQRWGPALLKPNKKLAHLAIDGQQEQSPERLHCREMQSRLKTAEKITEVGHIIHAIGLPCYSKIRSSF